MDVSDYQEPIDTGDMKATLTGYSFPLDERDTLSILVSFRDSSGAELSSEANTGFALAVPFWWPHVFGALTIPSGTRSIMVSLAGVISGTSSVLDAYFDDISLTLTVPELSVDMTVMDFGNLYVFDGQNKSAETFK